MKGKNRFSSFLILLLLPLFLLYDIFSYFIVLIEKLAIEIPILQRITSLLSNPIEALSSGGSGRTEIWIESFNVIERSPLFGVGFGSFRGIMQDSIGVGVLAHNTFIQIITEWGILFGGIFFIYIFFLLFKVFIRNTNTAESHIAKDVVFVLLIGSLGLSLNNSRLLWFFIGLLIYYSTPTSITKKS